MAEATQCILTTGTVHLHTSQKSTRCDVVTQAPAGNDLAPGDPPYLVCPMLGEKTSNREVNEVDIDKVQVTLLPTKLTSTNGSSNPGFYAPNPTSC